MTHRQFAEPVRTRPRGTRMKYTAKHAKLSEDGVYRYELGRMWGSDPAPCVFVMLNPSTANADVDDPTIRRCVGFADAWGFKRLVVVNLFGLRATDPRELFKVADPVGDMNAFYLGFWATKAVKDGGRLVAAWGNHGSFRGQDEWFRGKMASLGVPVHHLGLTGGGKPRHPLYLKADTVPVLWEQS